ncbi:hypothetical protein [Aliivibrio fischeri]|uniref:hypothetical protein n=1 Tax=Aliivibrio fischeri TaxID=668 RepID=UPI0012DACC6F|nr:hypothetical protein [Aliivibrio fischeri]MUL17580.1 hypothetical protein [Aliivibrio fischeri]
MSHDLYASWVTAELAKQVKVDTNILFDGQSVNTRDITSFANREPGRQWPIPDGRITLSTANIDNIEVAIELKRSNEGLHGVLTAVGQAQAYLKKGYDISAIVVPDSYSSYESPGSYIADLLDHINADSNIIVVSYSSPDDTAPSPFYGRLTLHRRISFTPNLSVVSSADFALGRGSQQWAHIREGSSDADVFFKYLQTSKFVSAANGIVEPSFICSELLTACQHMQEQEPEKYLSNCPNDELHDRVWQKFWFNYVLTPQVQQMVEQDATGQFLAADASTELMIDATTCKKFFAGRSDSIKNKIADFLNSNAANASLKLSVNSEVRKKIQKLEDDGIIDTTILSTVELSWIAFAINIHQRAHSFREDVDSGLEHIAMLESDGRPSELGYRFIDLCERTNDSYTGRPFLMLGAAILYQGQLASFLHYLHRISEQKFQVNPLEFSTMSSGSTVVFNKDLYLQEIQEVMVRDLRVINESALRGGRARQPFQAELAILSKLGLIPEQRGNRFRTGVGLVINWPKLAEYESFTV